MIRWLHRYIFRGIGILFAIGMLTALVVSVMSQVRQAPARPAAARTGR